jgi:hypothetical protein
LRVPLAPDTTLHGLMGHGHVTCTTCTTYNNMYMYTVAQYRTGGVGVDNGVDVGWVERAEHGCEAPHSDSAVHLRSLVARLWSARLFAVLRDAPRAYALHDLGHYRCRRAPPGRRRSRRTSRGLLDITARAAVGSVATRELWLGHCKSLRSGPAACCSLARPL